MEIPSLFKRKSKRPRSPEHVELGPQMRHIYSRALGVFAHLSEQVAESEQADLALVPTYKQDCIEEIVDAMACDDHREWLESEFDVRFRFTSGSEPILHAAHPVAIVKLEQRLAADFSRRKSEHNYAFAIGAIRSAISNYSRRSLKGSSWLAPPMRGDERMFTELRWFMAGYATRHSFEAELRCKMRFTPPDRITLVSGSA